MRSGASSTATVIPPIAMHEGTPLQVSQRDGAWVLTIELPFADRDEVALSRKGDELLVRIRRPPARDPVT